MTYIGCMNQLWRSAMMSPMPASEIALFAYLVNESNKRYWKMPFVCSTTRICDDLRLSRQTVITARKHLAERKLISFIEGKSRHVPSKYTMLEWTDGQTDSLTHDLTDDLTPIKDKDIYQNKVSFKEERCEIFDSKDRLCTVEKDYLIAYLDMLAFLKEVMQTYTRNSVVSP